MHSVIKSSPRRFTVWRHFQYDEKANAYFVFFSSTSYSALTPSPVFVDGEMRLPFPLSFTADIGYRVEPVNSGVTRITMIYSLYPAGRMSRYQYYIDSFQRSFLMGMSGLGTMLSQIPEYHVFNLIERIVNSLHADATTEKDSASTVSSVSAAISTTVTSGAVERDGSVSGAAERDGSVSGAAERDGSASDPSDSSDNESGSLSEKVLLPPYITNTVAHASECDLMVRAGCGRDP